jgi:N-acyl amino acid synthase FeeM
MVAAAVALAPAETRPTPRPEPHSLFSNRVAGLLDRLDCRVAETPEEREPIFRLRYEAYLREGAIEPNDTGTFTDSYDDLPNARIFGLYLDGELASSIRIHVTSPEHADFPSYHVFEDLLEPELRAGHVIVDPTRFATNKILSQLNPGLPYATLRLCWLACEHFRAEHFLVAIRTEHQAFYRRTFLHRLICDARPYPLLAKPISLMTVNVSEVAEAVYQRYPFFRSTYFERRMLFERNLFAPRHATVVPMDKYRAA